MTGVYGYVVMYVFFAVGLLGVFAFTDAVVKAWTYYQTVVRKRRF
jgi:hypothetical protein